MSGDGVSRALEARFDAVRRAEVERLQRKLGTLNEEERESAEQIIADVIAGLARVPSSALHHTESPDTLHAVVRLFGLTA